MRVIRALGILMIGCLGWVGAAIGERSWQMSEVLPGAGAQLAAKEGHVFVFDPKTLRWYAYEDGALVGSGRASGGANYCPDLHRRCHTPVGVFHVLRKGGANCRSTKYPLGRGGARMDYCMFFTDQYAIHGSDHVVGYNASHGCIRVLPGAAEWLSHHFINTGTKVIVKSY